MKLKCLPTRIQPSSVSRINGIKQDNAEADRRTSSQRGYGHKWRVARVAWLKNHPLCVFCEKDGKIVAANVVDHIIPHKGDMKLFWDSANNWQSLCDVCHNTTKKRIEAKL